MSAQVGMGIKQMPNSNHFHFQSGTEGADKDSFSGSPDMNSSLEQKPLAVKNRTLKDRVRTNFLSEPMLLMYSLVVGGLLLVMVIRIALAS